MSWPLAREDIMSHGTRKNREIIYAINFCIPDNYLHKKIKHHNFILMH